MRKICAIAILVVLVAMLVYGAASETGPMGWFNAAQMWVLGSYSKKFSFLLMMIVASPLLVLAFELFDDPVPLPGAAPALPTQPPARTWPSPVLAFWGAVWLVLVVLSWGVPLAVVAWSTHRANADAEARYEPVRLQRGTPPPHGRDHLALEGRMLWDSAVVRTRSGFADLGVTFVPVVAADWRSGDAVHYVVELRGSARSAPTHTAVDSVDSAETIRVRVAGGVPTPALRIFEKAGATIDAAAERVVLSGPAGGSAPAAIALDGGAIALWGGLGTGLATVIVGAMLLASREGGRRARGRDDAARAG